ncbi:MAG: 4Fe-4S binding protein [Pseudomonadota bacterium]
MVIGDISHAGAIAINRELCGYCGSCVSVCDCLALSLADTWLIYEPEKCSGCMDCTSACPVGAIRQAEVS